MPFLQLGYKRIHYTDLQPGNGHGGGARETFVCIHGLGSSQQYYHAVAQRLVAEKFRVVMLDTTGAARSPYTQVEQSIQTLADDVIGVMDQLNVEKAVVVGHSMGGIVAAHLAAERSDRVVASILVGPVYPNANIVPVFEKRIEQVQSEGMEAMANSIPLSALGTQASPLATAFVRELLLGQDPAGYISNCRVIVKAKPPEYKKMAVPVLILAGDEDKSAPLEGCEKMLEEMGTSEKKLEVMKGVGHWHCLEAVEEVSKLIIGFYHEIQ